MQSMASSVPADSPGDLSPQVDLAPEETVAARGLSAEEFVDVATLFLGRAGHLRALAVPLHATADGCHEAAGDLLTIGSHRSAELFLQAEKALRSGRAAQARRLVAHGQAGLQDCLARWELWLAQQVEP